MRLIAAASALALVLAGCAGAGGSGGSGPESRPAPRATQGLARSPQAPEALSGTLGGDAGLEGGCAWLDTPHGRYEVLWPSGYRIDQQPLRLIGPDGRVVAEAGDPLTVEGVAAQDMASFCQVGQLWEATAVRPDSG
ncbi:MAG: hypothetical protein M3N52_08100 [Actinomycetota bacterium]|nr:hypothetical protein [Actinomycetota bacterium]